MKLGLSAVLLTVLACSAEPSKDVVVQTATQSAVCSNHEACQDQLYCNGEERCEQGRCVAGEAPRCDDNDACTDDGCTEGVGCVYEPKDTPVCRHSDLMDAGVEVDATQDGALTPPNDLHRAPDVSCQKTVDQILAWTDQDLQQYAGVNCVTGGVYVGPQVTNLKPLSTLARVQSMELNSAASTFADLTALTRVDWVLRLEPMDLEPTTVRLPALRWVGGDVQGPSLKAKAVEFPSLVYVGGTLQVWPVEGELLKLSYPALEYVGGSVGANQHTELPALQIVAGNLYLGGAQASGSLRLLRVVGTTLNVSGNDFRGSLSLPALEQVGSLYVACNAELDGLSAPKLQRADEVTIIINPKLPRCEVDDLIRQVGGSVTKPVKVCCNRSCEGCEAGCTPSQPGDASAAETLPNGVDLRRLPTLCSTLYLGG